MTDKVSDQASFRIARISRKIMSHYERRCRDVGVTPVQLLVLSALNHRNASTIGELADELGFDSTTMTRFIQRMIELKLVERIADPADRRVQRVYLHKEAKKRLKSWLAAAEKIETELFAQLNEADRTALELTLATLEHLEFKST